MKDIEERLNKKCEFLIFDTVKSFDGHNYREGEEHPFPFIDMIKDDSEKLQKLESIIDSLVDLKKEMMNLDFSNENDRISTHSFTISFGYIIGHKDIINKPFES